VIEQIPTMPLHFKLKARFQNDTTAYLQPLIDKFMPTKNPAIKAMGFAANGTNSSLFSLTPDKNILSQSNELLGWRQPTMWNKLINGNLVFLDKNQVTSAKFVFLPFHIEVKVKFDKWEYKLAVEAKGMEFWGVTHPILVEGVPDEYLLLVRSADQMEEIARVNPYVVYEKVKILVEPVS
jgi:hypothetical protein